MTILGILALLAAVGLVTYEVSPSAHEWVDAHGRAIRALVSALHVANSNVDAAQSAADPATAAAHVDAAETAKQQAARAAVAAASSAHTDEQRAATAKAAAAVDQTQAAISVLKHTLSGVAAGNPDHARGMASALAAHSTADAHLAAAHAAQDPEVAAAHVTSADEANRAAAHDTSVAAATATTPHERDIAAQSAVAAVARNAQIEAIFASLGAGLCGMRSYAGVTRKLKDQLIARLRAKGMKVTGNNPWNIDTGQFGVRLRAAWDPAKHELRLIVLATPGKETAVHALCPLIWNQVDPILKEAIRG